MDAEDLEDTFDDSGRSRAGRFRVAFLDNGQAGDCPQGLDAGVE
jgi:hypothetical protein